MGEGHKTVIRGQPRCPPLHKEVGGEKLPSGVLQVKESPEHCSFTQREWRPLQDVKGRLYEAGRGAKS